MGHYDDDYSCLREKDERRKIHLEEKGIARVLAEIERDLKK